MKLINFSKKASVKQQPMAIILFGMALYLASSFSQAYAVAFPTINVGSAPDITIDSITVEYKEATDIFSADATGFFSFLFDDAPSVNPIMNGVFNLNATINNSGALSAGTISIGGNVNGSGPSLLTGDLTMFQHGAAGDAFEFIFDVTGGDLASAFGPVGGVILNGPGFGGDFTSDFGAANAIADVAAVPVPTALWLLATGLLSLRGFARKDFN